MSRAQNWPDHISPLYTKGCPGRVTPYTPCLHTRPRSMRPFSGCLSAPHCGCRVAWRQGSKYPNPDAITCCIHIPSLPLFNTQPPQNLAWNVLGVVRVCGYIRLGWLTVCLHHPTQSPYCIGSPLLHPLMGVPPWQGGLVIGMLGCLGTYDLGAGAKTCITPHRHPIKDCIWSPLLHPLMGCAAMAGRSDDRHVRVFGYIRFGCRQEDLHHATQAPY